MFDDICPHIPKMWENAPKQQNYILKSYHILRFQKELFSHFEAGVAQNRLDGVSSVNKAQCSPCVQCFLFLCILSGACIAYLQYRSCICSAQSCQTTWNMSLSTSANISWQETSKATLSWRQIFVTIIVWWMGIEFYSFVHLFCRLLLLQVLAIQFSVLVKLLMDTLRRASLLDVFMK